MVPEIGSVVLDVTRKEMDHDLASGQWKVAQNFRLFRSADSFGNDYRLLIATLGV